MGTVVALVRRNLLVYRRAPANALFSLLAALIVFLLYTLFLGTMQVESIMDAQPGLAESDVRGFVNAWMFGGIAALATITTPLGALSGMVEDGSTGRFSDFLVAPIRRHQLVMGYLISACIAGLVMSLVVFGVAILSLWAMSGILLTVAEVLRAIGWISLSVLAFTSLWALSVSFVRTPGAFTGLSTIVGTISGFVAGAYIAIGMFPDRVREVVSTLPFAQSAMLVRREFAADPLHQLVGGSSEAARGLEEYHGMVLTVAGHEVGTAAAVTVLVLLTVVCAALASHRIRKLIR